MEDYAVRFDHVSKIYRLNKKEKGEKTQMFYALRNLSFTIPKEEVVGILGTNGSGKSTMATILAGISAIDEGEMTIHGEQALVAVNLGLNAQLTGLENIKFKGALLGLKAHEIQEIIDGVIDFAELGDFLYQPVKKYSSGMKSRLGFSINLCLDPDILIVDEALSVGDKAFANKCLRRMQELKKEGKTIVFISHALPQMREFCDTALWIEAGRMVEYGPVDDVCDNYSDYVERFNALSPEEKKAETERKFQERVIENAKESTLDKLLGMFQGNSGAGHAQPGSGKDTLRTGSGYRFSCKTKVTELYGANRTETMLRVSSEAFLKTRSRYAVLASDENTPDALSASPLAGAMLAPVMLVSDSTVSAVVSEMKKLGVTDVYIVGNEKAISGDIEAVIRAQGMSVKRLSGVSRQETALAIANEVLRITGTKTSDTCIVASVTGLPDALSASPYAYYTRSPIYLTGYDGSVTEETIRAITEAGFQNIIVVGGVAAVTEEAYDVLSAIEGVKTERLCGSNRYQTSAVFAA